MKAILVNACRLKTEKSNLHADCSTYRMRRDEADVLKILDVFETTARNPFNVDVDCLINIVTGKDLASSIAQCYVRIQTSGIPLYTSHYI